MTSRADRERHVAQMLANFRLEGLEPDAADRRLQQAYIDGTATLDDLHNHAIEFGLLHAQDDGRAARSHLDAGRPIYYCDDEYPDEMVREWPDGRRELVKVDDEGKVIASRERP
jgi:hypothetical protein